MLEEAQVKLKPLKKSDTGKRRGFENLFKRGKYAFSKDTLESLVKHVNREKDTLTNSMVALQLQDQASTITVVKPDLI